MTLCSSKYSASRSSRFIPEKVAYGTCWSVIGPQNLPERGRYFINPDR
jgi:hypothetical protein